MYLFFSNASLKKELQELKVQNDKLKHENKTLEIKLEKSKEDYFSLKENISSLNLQIEKLIKIPRVFEEAELQPSNKEFSSRILQNSIEIFLSIVVNLMPTRDVLVLKNYFSGMTTKEQATIFNLSTTRVNIILKEALIELKNMPTQIKILKESKIKIEEEFKNNNEVFYDEKLFFELPTRILNVFKANDIHSFKELLSYKKNDVRKFNNLGLKSFNELLEFCVENNIPFGK